MSTLFHRRGEQKRGKIRAAAPAMIPFVILMTCLWAALRIGIKYIYLHVSLTVHTHIHTLRGKRGKEKKKKNHNSKSLRILSLSLSFHLLFLPFSTPSHPHWWGGGEVQRRFPAGWPFPSRVDWIIGLDTSRDLGVCRPYFFLLPFLSLLFSGRRSSLRKIYISWCYLKVSSLFCFFFSCWSSHWPALRSYLIPKVFFFFLFFFARKWSRTWPMIRQHK